MSSSCAALVHPIKGANLVDIEKRHMARRSCVIEATSRPVEVGEGMAWGGIVKDISTGGLKLGLCFPFRAGTYLAVDLQSQGRAISRTLVCRVAHTHDNADGTWTLGCEFLKPLSDGDVQLLI